MTREFLEQWFAYTAGLQSVVLSPAAPTSLGNWPHPDLLNWSRVGPRVCIFREFLGDTGDVSGSDAGLVSQGRQFGKH